MNLFWLDLARIIPLAVVVGYAAYKDIKYGEVSNKVWLYTPIGFALTLLSCFLNPQTFVLSLISIGATTLIAFTIFYLNGWGGADAKAFLMIGASLPITPFLQLNLVFMYPLNVIWVCAVTSFIVNFIRKRGKISKQDNTRFLPYVLLAMVLAIAI